MTTRRTVLLATAAAAIAPAWAQGRYPTRPIRLVVPFPAAGPTDVFARAVSAKVGELLGQSIVIDNKPGAGGAIGSDFAARAPADGYTLLLGTSSTHSVAPAFGMKLPYDTVADFTPIVHVGDAPNLMLVPNDTPAKDVKEWIAYARKNPGKLNYASSGPGTVVQLTAEYLKAEAKVDLTHVAYKGTALAMPDLMSGKVHLLFDSMPTGLPHVQAGRLRALAVTSLKRSSLLPDLPAVSETIPGFESVVWFGLYGPKGLPADLVNRVNTAVNEALQDKDVQATLARFGIERAGGTPQQFAAVVDKDRAKWKKIITEQKLTLQ
ncbi:MAG: Bug family tripartite tricarboxylate transporter substrate binding protein [Ramlibacter sp.]